MNVEVGRKCAYCEKDVTTINALEVQSVFGRYKVISFVTENDKPVLLCPDCLERVIYAAAKQLWEESGIKEVENG